VATTTKTIHEIRDDLHASREEAIKLRDAARASMTSLQAEIDAYGEMIDTADAALPSIERDPWPREDRPLHDPSRPEPDDEPPAATAPPPPAPAARRNGTIARAQAKGEQTRAQILSLVQMAETGLTSKAIQEAIGKTQGVVDGHLRTLVENEDLIIVPDTSPRLYEAVPARPTPAASTEQTASSTAASSPPEQREPDGSASSSASQEPPLEDEAEPSPEASLSTDAGSSERPFSLTPDASTDNGLQAQRDVDVEAGLPACIGCGCTENAACDGGCSWVSLDPPRCSVCVANEARVEVTDEEEAAWQEREAIFAAAAPHSPTSPEGITQAGNSRAGRMVVDGPDRALTVHDGGEPTDDVFTTMSLLELWGMVEAREIPDVAKDATEDQLRVILRADVERAREEAAAATGDDDDLVDADVDERVELPPTGTIDWRVLSYLADGVPDTIAAIAKALFKPRPDVARTVQRLTEQGHLREAGDGLVAIADTTRELVEA
jgi:DNA-binding transcriptional ArsR family regulator